MQTIITILICSLLLLGCGYTQLPKSEDTPEISRNIFTIKPSTHPINIFTDISKVEETYVVLDSLCSAKAEYKEGQANVLYLLIQKAKQIDADAIANINYTIEGEVNPPPLPPHKPGSVCIGGPPPATITVTGSFIKYLKNIPLFGANEKLTFILRCCPYYDISLASFSGKELHRVNQFTKSEYIIDTDRYPAGIYSIIFHAYEPLGLYGTPYYWQTMRLFEIQK